MDCAMSFKQSKEQLEVKCKETAPVPDRGNSTSSRTSDLSQDSAVSSTFQSDPPALQPKPNAVESMGVAQTVGSLNCLSRIRSSSRSGSSHIRLSRELGNHDPNRIPVSIFSGRPSNPMEWSTASNESLFSIHMGNSSFSREHFNPFTKSGELLMMNANSSQKLSTLPPFVEPSRVESKTEITPNVLSQNVVDHRKEVMTPIDELRDSQSVSNDSVNSSHSFQFPLLGGEGATIKTTSYISTASSTTQQQPVMKFQSTNQQSLEHHQSPSHQATSASPTANSNRSGWFSCLSCCRCRCR